MELIIENLSKSYLKNNILDNINLQCKGQSIYCLLGRNGAGKSTLINLLTNLIEPTSGQIFFNQLSFDRDDITVKRNIGLLSQYDQLLGDLNAKDYLHWIGLLYGLNTQEIKNQISNLLGFFFDNDEKLDSACSNYSSGMKKKLAFCAAVIHKPYFLFLDEPFTNLDPVASDKLCHFLNAYKNDERIIFVSSHDLLYVDKIATHIGIINNSKLVYNNTLLNFKNENTSSIDENLLAYLQPKNDNSSLLNSII